MYKGSIHIQDKNLSRQGIPIRCNSNIITHTSEDGSFSFYAKEGDTLQIKSPLYKSYLTILSNKYPLKITLQNKITKLKEVNVIFSESEFAEQIVRQALIKIKKVDLLSHTILLKQFAAKNNQDTLLQAEGLINYNFAKLDSNKFKEKNISIKLSDVCVHKDNMSSSKYYYNIYPKWFIFSARFPISLAKKYFPKEKKITLKYTDKQIIVSYSNINKSGKITIVYIIDKNFKTLLEIKITKKFYKNEGIRIYNYHYSDNQINQFNSYSCKKHKNDILIAKNKIYFQDSIHKSNQIVEWKYYKTNLQKYEDKFPPGCKNIQQYKLTHSIP